jgi:L-ribulose-5-phosphate 3-epimerase
MCLEENKMKTSIFSWFSFNLPLEERLRTIRQAGFDATILWWDGDDRHDQPELARRMGLTVRITSSYS